MQPIQQGKTQNMFECSPPLDRREGQALQRKAEAEAELKYQAGLALLKEMEAWEKQRVTAAPGS